MLGELLSRPGRSRAQDTWGVDLNVDPDSRHNKRVKPRSPLVPILGLGFGVAVIFGGRGTEKFQAHPANWATGAGFPCSKSQNRLAQNGATDRLGDSLAFHFTGAGQLLTLNDVVISANLAAGGAVEAGEAQR
jgi:hypothetical protein